jgi:hypothetical protein
MEGPDGRPCQHKSGCARAESGYDGERGLSVLDIKGEIMRLNENDAS